MTKRRNRLFSNYSNIGFQTPKLQILTVEGLLGGATLQYPHMDTSTFKKAVRQKKTKETQLELEGMFFKR